MVTTQALSGAHKLPGTRNLSFVTMMKMWRRGLMLSNRIIAVSAMTMKVIVLAPTRLPYLISAH